MPPRNEPKKSSSDDSNPPATRDTTALADPQNPDEANPDDEQSSQTVRRNRPAELGTQPGTTYGSITSYDTAPSRAEDDTRDRDNTRGSYSPSLKPGSDMHPITPQVSAKAKKPVPKRQASMRKQLPYRGQEFSIDDDPSELDENHEESSSAPQASGFSSMKRQTSTLRRRPTAPPTILPRVDSADEDEEGTERLQRPPSRAFVQEPEEVDNDEDDEVADDGDDDLSDAESFTLKDRQLAINQTHPFGIRIWKPALYKKNRSVEKNAEEDIHSSPSAQVSKWLAIFNVLWTLLFGWWLALAALAGSIVCFICAIDSSALEYGRLLASLALYLFYPFGQFVKLESDENYAEEDEGEGRSISEYERWQSGDLEHGRLFFGPSDRSIVGRRRNSMDTVSEHDSLLGRTRIGEQRTETDMSKRRRLFGRGQWTLGRVIFFVFFYFLIAPCLLLVSGICWLLVFWIPMGRVTLILFSHLRRHPLAMTFHSDATYSRKSDNPSAILLCTYRAVGLKYWKYTIDGTNILLINLLAIVIFTIIDYFVLDVALGIDNWLTNPGLIFPLALFSVIPLAYFIGQAVASISAQSSMGVGAAINAFFSTIVEVYLYCVALNNGKGQLVEGSVIGSIFAGVLLLPGFSMCFGALKRKTQRFNVRSAGVTSTMLLFAVVAAFSPTLFYQIYGSHELVCKSCIISDNSEDRDCRRCFFSQVPALSDRFYTEAVRPYCWISAVMLFLSYIVGLWFTLRTHAAVIWSTETDEKKTPVGVTTDSSSVNMSGSLTANGPAPINGGSGFVPRSAVRDSQLYKRILGQSLRHSGIPAAGPDGSWERESSMPNPGPETQQQDFESESQVVLQTPHVVPPKKNRPDSADTPRNISMVPGLSEEDNQNLIRQVTEIAATAATITARDATRNPRKTSHNATHAPGSKPPTIRAATFTEEPADIGAAPNEPGGAAAATGGGHDAPNWSKTKSAIILMSATVAYAVIAEILVDTVDVVLQSATIDQKFLGLTLFALVPNTTEFLNAISFAMNGNIALSMEIGSAYALQVCLLQVPALVLFSAVKGRYIDPEDLLSHTFNLIFPQWDMVLVILSVLLLSNTLGEGKSNYFKGSILVLTYLVALFGFWFSGVSDNLGVLGIDRFDTLATHGSEKFWTIGKTASGRAY